jgi:hypothetical protein
MASGAHGDLEQVVVGPRRPWSGTTINTEQPAIDLTTARPVDKQQIDHAVGSPAHWRETCAP